MTPEEFKRIAMLRNQGWSWRGIAVGMDKSYATIWRQYQEYLKGHTTKTWMRFKGFLRRK